MSEATRQAIGAKSARMRSILNFPPMLPTPSRALDDAPAERGGWPAFLRMTREEFMPSVVVAMIGAVLFAAVQEIRPDAKFRWLAALPLLLLVGGSFWGWLAAN